MLSGVPVPTNIEFLLETPQEQAISPVEKMQNKRFILNSSRSSKQGTLTNVGKDSQEYQDLTNAMTMASADMAEIGLAEGQMALVRTEFGEAPFKCQAGKI